MGDRRRGGDVRPRQTGASDIFGKTGLRSWHGSGSHRQGRGICVLWLSKADTGSGIIFRDGWNGHAIRSDRASWLESQPKAYRRVLLLISEERDHGSKHTKPELLVRKIGQSDVLVLSVSFSPAKAELLHDIKDSGGDRTMSMISTLFMVVQAFKKNVTKEVAHMSGGEYTTFTGDKRFEQRVVEAAKHARNRYLLTFSPSDPTPGLHTIRVRTVQDYGARIVARANYWLVQEP